jgi:Ni,Fe-hydrogenase III large subunit/Ni,Fe-hydrogenase III component G
MSAAHVAAQRLLVERPRRAVLELVASELLDAAGVLLDDGLRLMLMSAQNEGGSFRIVYLFVAGPPDQRIELHVRLSADDPRVPSLSHISFPAGRFEREMRDLFGIEPVGHFQPRALVLHQHWPAGWHPMAAGSVAPTVMNLEALPFPFAEVEGPGLYEIPVGPVHAGVIEPGHFRFWVVGETIVRMKARLWFTHKGVERLFEGRELGPAMELAERVSGDTAVGHSLAFCLAVEEALGIVTEQRTSELRAVLVELERLYNHVADVGALCNDSGFALANARALTLRERLLRLNERVTGHRLLRGALALGGATLLSLPSAGELSEIGEQFHELVALATANSIVMDRFTGTGILTTASARDIGVLGVVARASGLEIDARVTNPSVDLPESFRPSRYGTGDVLARFQVRCDEVDSSLDLLANYATREGPLEVRESEPRALSTGHGSGIVEGWRGTIIHRVEFDLDAQLTRVKIVDPSFHGWPALPVALSDTIVPDFPLVNKSFNLSYAGNDL